MSWLFGKQKKQPVSADDLRLARLRKEHLNIQRFIQTLTAKTRPGNVVSIQACVHSITRLIREDARSPAQLSLSYCLYAQIYVDVCKLAVKVNDEKAFRETIALFSFLLNNDADNDLLALDTFAQALLLLIDNVLVDTTNSDIKVAALALLFDVASKLRVYPEAVHAWFTRLQEGRTREEISTNIPETVFEVDVDRTSYPLCQHFLNHVYQKGTVGDFARTGLLYIYDSATRSDRLETWIIESDIPRLLASGLGALYSQLSRKLTINHPREELPMILALSEEGNDYEETDIESLYSPDTQERIRTFTSYITFWRDMIDRCRSDIIKDTLVDNFHVFFLQQILYPSILESSDVDGGSAVAVLSYCHSLLDALAQEDHLVHHMLHFLLALPGLPASRPVTRDATSERPKPRATMALEHFRKQQDALNPSFFSLVDLILATLQSTNSEAITAGLRLVSIIMRQQHQYAIGSLVRVLPAKQSSPRRTLGVLVQDTSELIQLAEEIGGAHINNDSYDNSLKDALAMIESHDCSKVHPSLIMLNGNGSESSESNPRVTKPAVYKHRLRMDDPLMLALLSLMDQFFVNEIEVNLVLTEVLAHLASCPYVCLEGWLAAEPSVSQTIIDAQSIQNASFDGTELYIEDDEKELEQQRIRAYEKACQIPHLKPKHQPSLVMILHKLRDDLEHATSTITDFNELVASRKRAFEGAAEMEDDASKSSPAFSRRAKSPGSPRSPLASVKDSMGSPKDRSITGMMSLGLPPIFELIAGKPKTTASPTKPLSTRTSHSNIEPLSSAPSTRPEGEVLSPTVAPPVQPEQEFNVFEQSVTFALDESGSLTPLDHENTDPFDVNQDHPKATLSRVLTNVIILQDFTLELAAIMQVRAGLFDGDISYC